MTDPTALPQVAPFSILLPPGWARIPIDDHADAVFADIIDGVVAEAPPERRAMLRGFLTHTAAGAITAARAQGALDVILSFAAVDGVPIPASIATFRIEPDASLGSTPERILVSFATAGSRAVEIDGVPAIRRVRESAATDAGPAHRSIHFVFQHPVSNDWMLLTASIVKSEEIDLGDVLEALEALIDAMVSTIRFDRTAALA